MHILTTPPAWAWLRRGLLTLGVALPLAVAAQGSTEPQAVEWEGALGLIGARGPAYMGAADRKNSFAPGFFLRYGRLTITNSGGFVTRRNEEVDRGLGLDLSTSDRWRVKLALRYDQGRDESDSPALRGLGNVKTTLRVRLTGQYPLTRRLKLGGSWSVDALGRGGGNFGDVGLQYELPWSADTLLTFSTALTLAGDRYLQSYFGVSAEQSARSAYPEYQPRRGLRDASVGVSLRTDLHHHWVMLGGVGVSELLGPAADSPFAKHRFGVRVSGGLAYRF